MCLFDERHCEQLSAFHSGNLLLISVILLSALSTQFLVRARFNRYNVALIDDEKLAVVGARIVFTLITLLPFSSAMLIFNSSIVSPVWLFHLLFTVPCLLGWVCVVLLCIFPLALIVDNVADQVEYWEYEEGADDGF